MAFSNAQHPFFLNCSFTEHVGNVNSYQDTSNAALQILWASIAPEAAYNSEERYPHPRCLPRTRAESIHNIQDWAENGTSSILWLHGPAGAGKSAVAQTICEAWAEAGLLLASFFFSRTAATRNTVDRFIPTIAYQSVQTLACRLDPILAVIEKNPQVLKLDIQAQLQELFVGPIKGIVETSHGRHRPRFIVIDAIDECNGTEHQLRLLSAVLSLVDSVYTFPLRFLIVSRPEPHIRCAFDNLLKPVSTVESLYGAIEDVYKYLEHEFNRIRESEKHHDVMQHVPKPWPGHEVLCELSERSGGYFIYAATVVRHVDEEGHICTDRLDEILDRSSRIPGSCLYGELDKVYSQILSTARDIRCLRRILGCILIHLPALVKSDSLAFNVPVSTIISTLFSFRPGELKMTLRGLHSIISLSENDTDDIQFYHASFSDYLMDKERSKAYYVDYEETMQDLYISSLKLLRVPTSCTWNSFLPGSDWAVATSIWANLGRPVHLLSSYLEADNGAALELLQPLITQSKQWVNNLQYRIICLLCTMMVLLQGHPFCRKTAEKLSSFCQSAHILYISSSNTLAGLECIQDARTLLEMDILKRRSWSSRELIVKELLTLSPMEKPSVDWFLSYVSRIGSSSLRWGDGIMTDVPLESGYLVDTRQILWAVFEKFLDNETIWGDACRKEKRTARLQDRLSDSARWKELNEERATQRHLKSADEGSSRES